MWALSEWAFCEFRRRICHLYMLVVSFSSCILSWFVVVLPHKLFKNDKKAWCDSFFPIGSDFVKTFCFKLYIELLSTKNLSILKSHWEAEIASAEVEPSEFEKRKTIKCLSWLVLWLLSVYWKFVSILLCINIY